MLYRQIIAAYCETDTKYKYIVVIMQSFNVHVCGTYSKHCTVNCWNWFVDCCGVSLDCLHCRSMELAMSAKEPYNYFLLLRALFRSIGGGSHDLLYQEFLPLLPSLLQGDTHTHTHTLPSVCEHHFSVFLCVLYQHFIFHRVLLLLNVFAYLWITLFMSLPPLYAWTTQKLLNRFSWNLVLAT